MNDSPSALAPRLRAVLFDLGDVLVRCDRAWPELLECGLGLCLVRLQRVRPGLTRAALAVAAEEAVAKRARELAAANRAFPAQQRVTMVLRALGMEPSSVLVDELIGCLYQPVSACSRPADDAPEILARLRRAGLRLGAVSNTPWDVPGELVRRDLARFGFGEHLEVFVFSDIDFRKPHPEMFRRALAALDVGAEEALMVGDSLAEDVAGARAVGLRALWLAPEADIAAACRDGILADHQAGTLSEAERVIVGLLGVP